MTIDYSSPGKVILLVMDYIGKILDDITEDMTSNAPYYGTLMT